jgi:hypothetical protein
VYLLHCLETKIKATLKYMFCIFTRNFFNLGLNTHKPFTESVLCFSLSKGTMKNGCFYLQTYTHEQPISNPPLDHTPLKGLLQTLHLFTSLTSNLSFVVNSYSKRSKQPSFKAQGTYILHQISLSFAFDHIKLKRRKIGMCYK